jgi:adenylate cyclase
LSAYRAKERDAAAAQLGELQNSAPHQPLSALYLARIAHFRAHPPVGDWDGVFVHESK